MSKLRWSVTIGMFLTVVPKLSGDDSAPGADRQPPQLVRQALEDEVDGDLASRAALLREALSVDAQYAPAHWHTGQVRWDKRWVRFDAVPTATVGDKRLADYQRMRANAKTTVEDQLRLAHWCRANGLPAQERAHLTVVLALDPDHLDARHKLGFQRVGDSWLTHEEATQAAEQARQEREDFARWSPRLMRLRAQLDDRRPQRRIEALAELRAIHDPTSITAMEVLMSTHSPDAALAVIASVSRLPQLRATLSLVRHAVHAPWPAVRAGAIEPLKERPADDYLPWLIESMNPPVQSTLDLYRRPDGRLVFQHVLFREGPELNERAVLETLVNTPGGRDDTLRTIDQYSVHVRPRVLGVVQANARSAALNQRIASVLEETTGADLGKDPKRWWDWWAQRNGVVYSPNKPLRQVYQTEQLLVRTPPPISVDVGAAVGLHSCFAAGTKICTASGPAAIERIQVGDLVLAQDPRTGELAYKPVVRTTVRERAPMLRLQIGSDTIKATEGHPFWVTGKGWVLARDLEAGARIHTVDGVVEVEGTTDAPAEAAYNLVVADFHSYFVASGNILVHDITFPKRAATIVPGLRRTDTELDLP